VIWETELTDTFGGQANYSWCDRSEFITAENTSCIAIVRRAKLAAGLSGVRGRTSSFGEGFEFRPYGMCVVLFILPRY